MYFDIEFNIYKILVKQLIKAFIKTGVYHSINQSIYIKSII